MSTFTALNIEPDEDSEEEIDDTKEIQIEEALKLYQNALKLHAQGPKFYPQAAAAYDALFKSEIFKYPESLSGYARSTMQDAAPQDVDYLDDAAVETLAEFDDSTSSTLLQTIYLSYKNHGQFLLDSLRDILHNAPEPAETSTDLAANIVTRSRTAMGLFAEALERDDTDLDLWRKTARLSSALQSFRLARFCLESVVTNDNDELEVRPELLGLEETFAMEDLRRTLQILRDNLSLSLIPERKPRKALLKFWKRQTDVYPYLPTLPDKVESVSAADPRRNPLGTHTIRQVIVPAANTWTAVGKAILQVIIDEQQNVIDLGPGAAIGIDLPAGDESAAAAAIEDTAQPPDSSKPGEDRVKSQEPQDIEMAESADQAPAVGSPHATKSQEASTATEAAEDQSSIDYRAEIQLKESPEHQSGQRAEAPRQQENAAVEEVESKPSAAASRKRSIGNDEAADGGRTKSRRIRARESNVDGSMQTEEVAFDQAKYYEDRLEVFFDADKWMFETVGALLSKVGVEDLGTIDELKKQVCPINGRKDRADISQTFVKGVEAVLAEDLRSAVMNWDEEKSRAVLQGDSSTAVQDFRGMNRSGLAIFLEHSRKTIRKPGKDKLLSGGEGLPAFVHRVNDGWLHLHEVAFGWLESLLMPEAGVYSTQDPVPKRSSWPSIESTYVSLLWPDDLKETVVQILIREDEFIYKTMAGRVGELERQILRHALGSPFEYTARHLSDMEMIQTLFEIHLDIYALINNPNSEVDQGTRLLQRDRLARWGTLARTSVNHFMDHGPIGEYRKVIGLRHLWSSTFHSNMAEDAVREHTLLCLQDLKRILLSLGNPVIILMNNAIMPEISIAALDQEISRLNSMDFFMKIFGSDSEDPVDLIESIEPILEPSSVEFIKDESGEHVQGLPTLQIQEIASFLDRADATMRLFLWRRLEEAYTAINYSPKTVSCYLRSIEVIMRELRSTSHLEGSTDQRQVSLLRWLKSLDDLLKKTLTQVVNSPEKSYECVDMDHLRSSMSAVVQLTKLLHSFALYEDSVRVGQISPPEIRGPLSKSLENFKDKLRDMQVRCWTLLYSMVKETMSQEKELFDTPVDDRVHFLRSVHNALGVRSICKHSNKLLLKLMKKELLTLQTEEDYESDISQVLFDLHGLKFSAYDGSTDHGCPPERLDRDTAIMMMDFVMMQAKRMSIKDLSKSELKHTMEQMQSAIGMPRSSTALQFNRRVLSAYLKSPINPSHLFRAVQGIGDLSMVPVPAETTKIAEKGWYFLLGYAALTKFRSQKRLNPVPTTDLDEAISYFKYDLEHGTGRWETWYRLAQTYDSKLEEDVTWSADKINSNRTDLVLLQRNAIHCYSMAVASAIRTAEPSPEARAILSDLYTDFGIRMYSSSREPFSMGAFSLADFTRHFSSGENQQMYKGRPFKEMRIYSVWKFASYLLRKAMVDKPNLWMNHYMLSKCLWKMFSCDDSIRGNANRVEVDDVLDSLLDAIEALPERKDSRSEPIFEPHFRLVSVVHKLVRGGVLKPTEGSKTLLATPWARKVPPPEDNPESWQPYILEVLKNLRNADKSNWHHRIVARAAHVIYDDHKDVTAAMGAKHEFTQQIFTKTMTLQVWKPEFERPGRHFVYTTRYVYFFVHLLDQLNDRASLDQLLRRVRKRQGDFINHSKLWEDICIVYIKLIRRAGNIPEGHEEGVFKGLSWDEFVANTARLETWTQDPASHSPILDLLRDAVELKKLNNNLMKVTMFEDLIADLYAHLYEMYVPQFIEQANEENKEKMMKVDHLLMPTAATASDGGVADTPTPPTSAPPSEAPAPPRGRTKGIARRDIQKRAETIVNRNLIPRAQMAAKQQAAAAEGAEATTTATSTTATQRTPGAPAPPAPAAAAASTAPEPGAGRPAGTPAPLPIRADLRAVPGAGAGAGAGGAGEEGASGMQSSAPGSVHDSADDESDSELSEIDEEKLSRLSYDEKRKRHVLFPNLPARRRSPEPMSELSVQDEGDGDVEAEGEEGDEGEGDVDEAEVEGDGEGDGDGDEGGEEDADDEVEGEGEGESELPPSTQEQDQEPDEPEPEAEQTETQAST